jgi:hypothetical protein
MPRYNTLPVSYVSIIRASSGDYKLQMAMPCHAPSEWLAERPRESVQLHRHIMMLVACGTVVAIMEAIGW